MCHAAEPSYEGIRRAPKGVMLESDAEIAAHAREIYLQAGRSHAMPPANVTEITADERALLVAWFESAVGQERIEMPQLLLRGRVLTFTDEPGRDDDASSYRYFEDGAVLISDGKIARLGDFADVSKAAPDDAERIDHRPHLIVPGFIDAHIHFPQMQVIGSYGTQLLDWLNNYTFVEEQKFAERGAFGADRLAVYRRDDPARHDDRRRLLLGAPRVGGGLFSPRPKSATC